MRNGGPASAYDSVADDYESIRPSYPASIFSTVADYANVGSHARVLEVGCGTGQATRQMESMGWEIEAIEPGAQLIATAELQKNSPATRFLHSTFENATIEAGAFDVVAAGTSWHWTDPDVAYDKAHSALRPSGTIALFWNAHVPHTALPSWAPIRAVYSDIAPQLADLPRLTPDRPDYAPETELRDTGLFTEIQEHIFPFEISYTAKQFLRLTDTYASHASLAPTVRRRLHEQLRRTIRQDLDGKVAKPYEALLILGRRSEV